MCCSVQQRCSSARPQLGRDGARAVAPSAREHGPRPITRRLPVCSRDVPRARGDGETGMRHKCHARLGQ